MPKSTFIDFKAVKTALKMEEVLRHYQLLDTFKRTGESLSGPCPIHKGTNPTQFRVSIPKNIWNCFSECKNGGNVLDFIAQMEGVTIHAAASKAIEWFNLDQAMPRNGSSKKERKGDAEEEKGAEEATPEPEPESTEPNKPLRFTLDKLQPDHPFLKKRGLTDETIREFGVGFCAKGMMANRIAIPIANFRGDVVAYAGRFPGEPTEANPKYKLPPGFRKSLELYNLKRAIQGPLENPLVIVEGFFDCMMLHQCGLQKTVALMGTSLSDSQLALILQFTSNGSHIIVSLDDDEAGEEAAKSVALKLAPHRYVRIHTYKPKNGQLNTPF
jgi:DNA primase